jgi:hypothetical protein
MSRIKYSVGLLTQLDYKWTVINTNLRDNFPAFRLAKSFHQGRYDQYNRLTDTQKYLLVEEQICPSQAEISLLDKPISNDQSVLFHSSLNSYDVAIGDSENKKWGDRELIKAFLSTQKYLQDGDHIVILGGSNGQIAFDIFLAARNKGIQLRGITSIDVRAESMQIGRATMKYFGISDSEIAFYQADALVSRNWSKQFPQAKRIMIITLLPPVLDEQGNKKLLESQQLREEDKMLVVITHPQGLKYELHEANISPEEKKRGWHVERDEDGIVTQSFITSKAYKKMAASAGYDAMVLAESQEHLLDNDAQAYSLFEITKSKI